MNLTFITSNPMKVEQLGWHLKFPVTHESLELPEIQSLNLDEVVTYKARAAFDHIQAPVLVEDFSLVIPALGKLPGPLIKYFLEEIGADGIFIPGGYRKTWSEMSQEEQKETSIRRKALKQLEAHLQAVIVD